MDAPPPPPPPPLLVAHAVVPAEAVYARQPRREIPLRMCVLHDVQEDRQRLLRALCDLLASKWPKSDEARLASLGESCDAFPVHLVLLDAQQHPWGFASLTKCVEDADALLLENVIVDDALRGMGYGKTLMDAVHAYAQARGARRVFLSTRDKQDFYRRMGYAISVVAVTPLTVASQRLGNAAINKLASCFGGAGAAAAAGGAFTWMMREL